MGPVEDKPALFVVRIQLSSLEESDVVTVWQNPDLSTGKVPSGGVSVSGLDMEFDRISVAHFGRYTETSWDEFRFGHSFLDVTLREEE